MMSPPDAAPVFTGGNNNKHSYIDDFLHPQSMLTPGMAGAVTMLITNSLWLQFGLQQQVVALVLSFLLGSLVFIKATGHIFMRAGLYVVNSLIIFSIAIGSHTAAAPVIPKVTTWLSPNMAWAQKAERSDSGSNPREEHGDETVRIPGDKDPSGESAPQLENDRSTPNIRLTPESQKRSFWDSWK